MERAIQPEIPSPSCGADERLRQHREASTRTRLKPHSAVQVAVRLEPPDAQVEGTVSTQNSRESRLRRDVNKLKRLLADKTVEVDFFRSALQRIEARRQQSDISGEKASTMKFEMPLQGGLSIERMCQSAQVSRAGFYRYLNCRAPEEEDMTVRSTSQTRRLYRSF